MAILDDLKELLEIDLEEKIYDRQLLLYANGGIAYLKNNAIPVTRIDETTDKWDSLKDDDSDIVIQWLHLYCLQRYDRTLMSSSGTTQEWIDSEMSNLIMQLKVRYDREVI